jgi:hypothetical protein
VAAFPTPPPAAQLSPRGAGPAKAPPPAVGAKGLPPAVGALDKSAPARPPAPAPTAPTAAPAVEYELGLSWWPPWCFIGLSLFGHNRQRFRAWQRRRHGPPGHSYDEGRPDLLRWLRPFYPNLTEWTCKRHAEPVFVAAIGMALVPLSALLGVYLMLAAALLAVSAALRFHRQREQVLDVGDGVMDMLVLQEGLAEHYGGAGQGDGPPARAVAHVPDPPRAAPAKPPPSPPRPARRKTGPPPADPAVPPALLEGLDDNLRRLLSEGRREEE